MRLTFGIVVLHILERSECRLHGDIVPLVTGVVVGETDCCGDDVWFSVLLEEGGVLVMLHRGQGGDNFLTLVAVLARILYCSSRRRRSSSLGILKRVIRSMGAILLVGGDEDLDEVVKVDVGVDLKLAIDLEGRGRK